VMDKASWHYDNKSYELPYDFATGNVTLYTTINLISSGSIFPSRER